MRSAMSHEILLKIDENSIDALFNYTLSIIFKRLSKMTGKKVKLQFSFDNIKVIILKVRLDVTVNILKVLN